MSQEDENFKRVYATSLVVFRDKMESFNEEEQKTVWNLIYKIEEDRNDGDGLVDIENLYILFHVVVPH